jgi:hypothetical protein
MMTTDELQKLFTFTPLGNADLENVGAIRQAGLTFAMEIMKRAPMCGSRDSAVQHVLEAVMLANVSIANAPTPTS